MKIYEIATGYTPLPARIGAATEIVVEELTKALLKKGRDVTVIDIRAPDRTPCPFPIEDVSVPFFSNGTDETLGLAHKAKRVLYSISLARHLKKILAKSHEKVLLHFHNQYNMFFFLKLTPRALRDKALIAYTNHNGVWSLDWKEAESVIRKRYFQEAECVRRADMVFALNPKAFENIVERMGVSKDKVRLIDNGCNTEAYHPCTAEEIAEARREYGLSGKKVLLQAGSINDNKGQKRVLRLLAPLLSENPDWVYVCAGGIISKAYYQEFQSLAAELGLEKQVKYMGEIAPGERLNALYNIAEASILMSKYEAFGMVIPESMAAGTPVLLEKSKMFVEDKGIIPFDTEHFSRIARDELMNAERLSAHRQEARETAVARFSWEAVADCYDTYFRELWNP